ncbi:hypothetical protein BCR44DRAFT_1440725 [Catenaria anguillulae PL171]|uniref:Uncharacterized protein n=1 Tax=Catenaria anguillulae PL171 TaxID=765915 RepID=A0A1Y2HCB4_9FUNG|nr:hypothetical protein BCR44DRAFT_1440710 [Catenaria anguillulae PL171]ORZ32230.1 hypothetical protein BCR44DRAFT_1440725 [Catenaria anguillulae PL171]
MRMREQVGLRGSTETDGDVIFALAQANHVVCPSLKSLTVTVADQLAPLSFAGFAFPNLRRLTLDMQHPWLDGFTDAPLRYLTIRGSHSCPRFVSQLLAMTPVDPSLRVRFLPSTSPSPEPQSSVASRCLPNPLRLRFAPPIDHLKWKALMHAPPFVNWGEEHAVVVQVADSLTGNDSDLIVAVLGRLLSKQSRPAQIAALLEPAAIADFLTEEEANVFEQLCGRLRVASDELQ